MRLRTGPDCVPCHTRSFLLQKGGSPITPFDISTRLIKIGEIDDCPTDHEELDFLLKRRNTFLLAPIWPCSLARIHFSAFSEKSSFSWSVGQSLISPISSRRLE